MEFPFTNQLLYIKRNVINVLLRNANSEPFKIPVNPELLGVPQYPKLIKSPMDFGTIKLKLDKRAYQTANECKIDFLDIFKNCYVFNEPGSPYIDMALKLENLFKRKMSELPMPEIYVPESALQTVKLNKVKKVKLPSSTNTPISVKHKPTGLIPISPVTKTEPSHVKKRSRSNSGNGFKDEPSIKKSKGAIDLKTCKHIIMSLMSKNYHDWNRYFLEPVDVDGLKLHDYYTIVQKPMDLGTVKSKLLECRYPTSVEFAEDIKLIFKNCYLYNPEGHEVRRCGKLLEGVFVKLYQNSFPHNKQATKPAHTQPNYIEFQPLLQKILKRQTEIDVLNSDIVKRNQEIQHSLEFIKNTDIIKTFKASFNCNKKVPVSITKKPITHSLDSNRQDVRVLAPPSTVEKSNSPRTTLAPNSKNDISHEPLTTAPKSTLNHCDPSTTKVPKSDTTQSDHFSINHKSTSRSTKTQSDDADVTNHQMKLHVNVDATTANDAPITNNNNSVHKAASKTTVMKETVEQEKADEFNSRLKEIKTWISSQSEVARDRIKDFINKSEARNVAQVNLLKLMPKTINGLYTMMKETPKNIGAPEQQSQQAEQLRDFTNEDRMKLSHDLSILGDKYSEKILSIYKKTESVESHDGECEIDFEKMKLVTLHRLREFADKYLQKRQEKQDKTNSTAHPVGQNGDDSDSDSSDSSESDSNSDASSNSSSDAAFFNNLPQAICAADSSMTATVSVPPSNHTSPATQSTQSSQPLPPKPVTTSPTYAPSKSRLSDSSDSDLDDQDDPADSSVRHRRYPAPWNKHIGLTTSDVKSPVFTPPSKTKPTPAQHPMFNHNARNQLDESLRQIVQDAQAHENVKKQEEELRLSRMKKEEEQKKQQLLKMQAMNESKMKLHSSEQMKKDMEINRVKEKVLADQRQRNLDMPQAVEREDYHQLLCDFEYNIDHNTILKFVHLEAHQMHL